MKTRVWHWLPWPCVDKLSVGGLVGSALSLIALLPLIDIALLSQASLWVPRLVVAQFWWACCRSLVESAPLLVASLSPVGNFCLRLRHPRCVHKVIAVVGPLKAPCRLWPFVPCTCCTLVLDHVLDVRVSTVMCCDPHYYVEIGVLYPRPDSRFLSLMNTPS